MRLKSMVWGFCLLLCSVWAQAQTAAYIRGASQPWGESTNESAMDLAFGAGNWSNLTMSGGVVSWSNEFVHTDRWKSPGTRT